MNDTLSHLEKHANKQKEETTSNLTSFTDANEKNDFHEVVLDLNKTGVVFSRSVRCTIFLLILLTNLIINMDHGTIPPATSKIKADLNIDDGSLGIFGSLVYLGNILGAVIFMSVMRDINRKWIIVGSLIMIFVLIYLFAVIKNQYLLFLDRAITGIFQSFMAIYFPVWCDQFGPKNRKNSMIAYLQICVPLGVVFGYILTWTYSLYIQCGLTGLMIVCFLFIPSVYFSPKLHNQRKSSIENRHQEHDSKKMSDAMSVYKESIDTHEEKFKFISDLKILSKNYIFICCATCLAILYFVITVIQFWGSDYLKTVLNVEENIVSIAFTFTCVSAPTLGIILGGCSLNKVGGPQTLKATLVCVVYSIGALLCSLPIPFAEDVYFFTGFLWFVLFFGGATVPIITGIIITSVPPNVRSSGNSLSNLMSNLIGYLPAPFVYGFISKFASQSYPRLAITVTMYSSALGVVFMSIAAYLKWASEKNQLQPKRSRISSDLSVHVKMIANLWGNKNIENNQEIAEESKDSDSQSINKDSFFLEENENEYCEQTLKKGLLQKKDNSDNCLNQEDLEKK